MVAMPPCPSNSTSRYRPPRTVPMFVKRPPWVPSVRRRRLAPPSSRGGHRTVRLHHGPAGDAGPRRGHGSATRPSAIATGAKRVERVELDVEAAQVAPKVRGQVGALEC